MNKGRTNINENANIGKVAKNMKPVEYDVEGDFSDSNMGPTK